MLERLSEPLHMNVVAAFVALFGNFNSRVEYDLVFRQYTAFCMLDAAKRARSDGLSELCAVEFGVASGAGLLNMVHIAKQVRKATGVQFHIYGFDTTEGLPPARDYRDHPELYGEGDYVMPSRDALIARLPDFAHLVVGPIADNVVTFRESIRPEAPLGYVSLDVDYYFSSVDALQIFEGDPNRYLPFVNLYLDDVHEPHHMPMAGEMLAIREFNDRVPMRQAFPYTALREKRLFKRAAWISKIYAMHVLDHPKRSSVVKRDFVKVIHNPDLAS